jgi:hypothetical protein
MVPWDSAEHRFYCTYNCSVHYKWVISHKKISISHNMALFNAQALLSCAMKRFAASISWSESHQILLEKHVQRRHIQEWYLLKWWIPSTYQRLTLQYKCQAVLAKECDGEASCLYSVYINPTKKALTSAVNVILDHVVPWFKKFHTQKISTRQNKDICIV